MGAADSSDLNRLAGEEWQGAQGEAPGESPPERWLCPASSQTEGWSRFPRSILRLTPKRDVAGRSATAYLKHLLDLVPSSS